jgi:threonine/homoserine/homoserine lactone efflux protein
LPILGKINDYFNFLRKINLKIQRCLQFLFIKKFYFTKEDFVFGLNLVFLSIIYKNNLELIFIIKGLIIGISVSAPVGPVGILCMQKTINKGFSSGFVAGAGAAAADIIYAVIAGFSLTFISDFLIDNQIYIRIIGGIFLSVLGLKIFMTNPVKQIRRHQAEGKKYFTDFFTSFAVTISNPITILAFGTIFAGFKMIDTQSSMIHVTTLVATVFTGALIWWGTLVSLVSVFKKRIRLRNLWWINKITGIMIILFAIFVAASVFFPETATVVPKAHLG